MGKKYILNGIEYELVDSYEYVNNFGKNEAIKILKNELGYFVENYEGMGLYIGPFEEAIKTGANGEVLVKDFGQKFYYVPGIGDSKKPDDVGFRKEYHPEYHYAVPYTYPENQGSTPARMSDGGFRIKYCDGKVSEQKFNYYYQDKKNGLEVYQDRQGDYYACAGRLVLPLERAVRPDSGIKDFDGGSVPSYQIVLEFANYRNGDKDLKDLPYSMFLSDNVLEAILDCEKDKIKRFITNQARTAKSNIQTAAGKEDLSAIEVVEIDMAQIQRMLDVAAAKIIEKRKVALREQEQSRKIEEQEQSAIDKMEAGLDFDSIVKKTAAKPKKKKSVKAEKTLEEGD